MITVKLNGLNEVKAMLNTKMTRIPRAMKEGFEEVASTLVSDIKQHILTEDLSLEPLLPQTIARKERNPMALPEYYNKPWIESGAFVENLGWKWIGYGKGMAGQVKSISIGVPSDAKKILANGNTVFVNDYILANEMRRPLIQRSVERFKEEDKILKILEKKFNEV